MVNMDTFFKFTLSSILFKIGNTIAKLDKEANWLKVHNMYSEIFLSLKIGNKRV